MGKPILCLDFDGVIHSYASGWTFADDVPDAPVEGAMRFIWDAAEDFEIAIFSSRSHQPGGKRAMQKWLSHHFREYWAADRTHCDDVLAEIRWPDEKPAAFVTIDDRAICFDGTWPDPKELRGFRPWNKNPNRPVGLGATHTAPQGLLNDDDEGALKMAVGYDKVDGIVRLDFGKPVAWLGLPPPEARALAMAILSKLP